MPSVAWRALAMIGAIALSGSVATIVASGIALSTASPTAAASHNIAITDSAFGTAVLTVQVGDTVTWTNADDRPHTVTSQDGAFDSGNVDEGAAFSFTFTAPGTYTYLCEYHPDMTGTIVAEAAAAPAPANPQPAATPAPAGGTASAPSQHAGIDATDQPDTAVASPGGQIPAISYLLWGAGLLLLGIRFLPRWARTAVSGMRPPGGWRR
jgi:plastocyanin